MAVSDSQTPILLIILIIICSIIGGLILVICATFLCKYCYKIKLRKDTHKSLDKTISKSQSTITIYKNRKMSRIASVTATEMDEESITALVKKYKDTVDQDYCDLSPSSGSVKNLFKVLTPTKEIGSADIYNGVENNVHLSKRPMMRDSSCQTFITLDDIIYTQRFPEVNEDMNNHINCANTEPQQNTKINEMYHIVPPTDYRRNSQHLRPFDTHWGNNALSRSFDQMPDRNLTNTSRKTFSFDECESNPQEINAVTRTNSFDNRYQSPRSPKPLPTCKKQISVTSGQSSKTSSSISNMSISQNYHDNNSGNFSNKYVTVSTRVRSCSRLGKDPSSANSSFNNSSERNNSMIRSSHEINRSSVNNNAPSACRRKCNSERSPVRKVVVTRVTSKSLESRNNSWQPSDTVENVITTIPSENKYVERYIQKQHSECYPSVPRYPSSQYRQNQFIRHKSMDVSRNMNERQRNKTNSYCRMNSEMEKNQLSLESEETLDRSAEPHLSRIGLVNISMDNSEYQFNNFQMIPDIINSSIKDDRLHRESIQKSMRNPFQNLCRSNTSLEMSNNLSTTAAIRRRQFSQERRKVNQNGKDSKGSLSKSVYDDYSSFILDNLDDRKGKSMIFDRFFNSQLILCENLEPKPNKPPCKHHCNDEIIENKDYKGEENRVIDEPSNFIRSSQRIPTQYLRSKSQNQDPAERWINQPIIYTDSRSNVNLGNGKSQIVTRRQLMENEILSKSIDRTIPTIIFPDNE